MKRIIFIVSILIAINYSCKKEDAMPIAETGTLTDIDNNIYKTIKIGDQWWMTENLKTTRFRDGSAISDMQYAADWVSGNPGYCVYDDNQNAPGLLYNFNVVSDSRNIAPDGWHIPTDDDWKELEKYLGMPANDAGNRNWRGSDTGDKLKAKGTTAWTAFEDIWPTNESGFNALAGSCRLFDGKWGSPGLFATGFWWTASERNSGEAWYRYLDYKNHGVYRNYTLKNYGFSIRCVKN
jgi:uncharacterized protein (TIGR02145 family)